MSNIDWSKFDDLPPPEVACGCGTVYRSHAKVIFDGPQHGIWAHKQCPGCGRSDHIVRISTDPEVMTL